MVLLLLCSLGQGHPKSLLENYWISEPQPQAPSDSSGRFQEQNIEQLSTEGLDRESGFHRGNSLALLSVSLFLPLISGDRAVLTASLEAVILGVVPPCHFPGSQWVRPGVWWDWKGRECGLTGGLGISEPIESGS